MFYANTFSGYTVLTCSTCTFPANIIQLNPMVEWLKWTEYHSSTTVIFDRIFQEITRFSLENYELVFRSIDQSLSGEFS